MARSIATIKKTLTDVWLADATVQEKYGVVATDAFENQFSKVSIESIFFYIVAFCAFVVESIFDTHKTDVTATLTAMKPHTLSWYATTAKSFEQGVDLNDDGTFDDSGYTDAEIEAKKIVSYAAVTEGNRELNIKVAKTVSDDLDALSTTELTEFISYMAKIKDAGVHLNITSDVAEELKLNLTIYYNPLVLNSEGERVDGDDDTPILSAIKDFLQNIEFDGTLILAEMVDALQAVEGVVIPNVEAAYYKYGALDWTEFQVLHNMTSGYIRIAEENLNITYIARS